MRWQIEFQKTAQDALENLDKRAREQIEKYLDRLITLTDPRLRGKSLTGNRKGQWRYRVGDYRVICEIKDNILTVLVLEIGHRRDVYKNNF